MPNETATMPSDEELLADANDQAVEQEKEVETPKESVEAKEEEEVKEEEVKEEEQEEEKEEEEEQEEEEEEPKKIPYGRPTIREIKAKYPDFFKDFPSLRDAFFREQEYTQLFPTVEDAREAFEDIEAFRNLQDSVLSGDPKPLLDSIEQADSKALGKFAASFLPSLYKRDTALYTEVVTPLFENMVRSMYQQGMTSGDSDLANAALHASKYLFDTEEVASGKKSVSRRREESPEEKEVEEQRRALNLERYQEFYKSVASEIDQSLRSIVSRDFDPDGVFTPFLKRKCIEEVIDQVGAALEADANHMAVMKSHWTRAGRNGYSRESKDKIVAAYLARARSLIPAIRDKVRREALGTTVKASRKTKEAAENKRSPKESPTGAPPSKPTSVDARQIDWRKTSDLDFLEDRITLRS